jgi:SET domain-containing protein
MIEKKIGTFSDFALYAGAEIKKGALLFSFADWIEDEKEGWLRLKSSQLSTLPEDVKKVFLKYGYDHDWDEMVGPTNSKFAKNDSNFMNHSCDPNMVYDEKDNIIAKRDIKKGEELTIDYANFVVNVDQDFECRCGAKNCRKHIKKDDWKILCKEIGLNFPTFMHAKIKEYLKQK